jgi:hypothetical protein
MLKPAKPPRPSPPPARRPALRRRRRPSRFQHDRSPPQPPLRSVGLSLPLTRSAKAKPSARLQFTPARPAGGTFARPGAAGLELGLAPTGKPELYLGGRPAQDLGRRLNVGGSTTTVLVVVGGLVLLVLLANAFADAQPTPGPKKGAFD